MPGEVHPQYVIDAEGKPQGVLLPIEEFEELLDCAQDVFDAAEIERLKHEPRIPWSKVKAERQTERKE